ncbi:hypothetical protein [Microtetraspora niveoalba]|uniref:hypothetical protein n=1 Tax=Microtetraspora niveoalba TaxID=46175 RepID=UPI00082F0A0B|nr:hypothetical protein [Microtetraspora niveoalba]
MGDRAVVFAAAQPGMASFSATTRAPHSAQLPGFIGMIFATPVSVHAVRLPARPSFMAVGPVSL